MLCMVCVFCKQKTAYEMRIRDWSSDVCAADRASVPSSTGVSFSMFVINLAYQSGERLGGEVHHGNDARIVQACRADDPDHADDAPVRSAIGRGDNRRARKRKELILRPDENAGRAAQIGRAHV